MADHINQARDWINDCYWNDLESSDHLTDTEVRRGIENHYDGGWDQFVQDC